MMKGVFLSNQVFKQTIMNTTYGNVIGADTMENSMEVPQKSKRRTTIWSSNSTPEYISKEKWTP